jgi:hypothetical protein
MLRGFASGTHCVTGFSRLTIGTNDGLGTVSDHYCPESVGRRTPQSIEVAS